MSRSASSVMARMRLSSSESSSMSGSSRYCRRLFIVWSSQSEAGDHHHDPVLFNPEPEQAMRVRVRFESIALGVPGGFAVKECIERVVDCRQVPSEDVEQL